MIIIMNNSSTTRRENYGYSFQIMYNNDGTTTTLLEGDRFGSVGEVLEYTSRIKHALQNKFYSVHRDKVTNSYAYAIYANPQNPMESILEEGSGWMNSEDAQDFIKSIIKALEEGTKVL